MFYEKHTLCNMAIQYIGASKFSLKHKLFTTMTLLTEIKTIFPYYNVTLIILGVW